MPDAQRKTISATQAPALFNASPYVTRWMLYRFLKGDSIEREVSDRMSWGLRLQPLVLQQAADDLKLEVTPNMANTYVRATFAPLGYTSDALIHCPDRGAGAIEVKCVFDYGTWMREWHGGKAPPKHYELQLAQQITVGDGTDPFKWGVIAAWVAGEMHYFERAYDATVATTLAREASVMLEDVAADREPDPFGVAVESPLLRQLFPVRKGSTLDLRDHADGAKWRQHAAMFRQFKEQESFYDKAAGAARDQILALARDHETILLPGGASIKQSTRHVKEHMRKASSSITLKVDLGGEEAAAPTEPEWTA